MKNDSVEVVWSMPEATRGLSDTLIWGLAVRSRTNDELTRFLDVMEINGSCDVVIFDAEGREIVYPCMLPSRRMEEAVA